MMQADWKPEAPEKFGDITDLVKSVNTLKIDEPKKQGYFISIIHKNYKSRACLADEFHLLF